jgi:hypothetical protein
MGVPKFYRFLSERYPLINEKLTDTSMMPHVDNLYLGEGTAQSLFRGEMADVHWSRLIIDTAIALVVN